ncbi:MAG: GntR family transcriptional regulator [Acutalibacteraceae bacterium]
MVIVIKNNSSEPIYDQIKNQILDAIISGELKEGECLPSIRGLAKNLKVSVITTTKAYNELETTGYIKAVQGKGYYVSERSNKVVREKMLEQIEDHFDRAIEISKKAGISEKELTDILQNLLKQEE